MFWPIKRSRRPRKQSNQRRRLFLEPLEPRRVLAGVVDIITVAPVIPGDVAFFGDDSNNQIEVAQGAMSSEFVVTGKGGTLLMLNGGPQTFSSLTINGIPGDHFVDLGGGDDTYELVGPPAGGTTTVGLDLVIYNGSGSDTNILRNAIVNGDLDITKVHGPAAEYSELQILDSLIRGDTTVDNIGGVSGNGDSKTMIQDSELEGTLEIFNAFGEDINDIQGSRIAQALFARPSDPVINPAVIIDNGDGGSRTTFTRGRDPLGLGRPTIFGGIDISNGSTAFGQLDIVTFNDTDVLGGVDIDNGAGDTEVIVVNSELGTDYLDAGSGGYGGPVFVVNGDGYDEFTMRSSEAQYGLLLDNNGFGLPPIPPIQVWGSNTVIEDSMIGDHPLCDQILGAALLFFGDLGNDTLNVSGSTISGEFSAYLFDGNDQVSTMNTVIASLTLLGDAGDDMVHLENTTVHAAIDVSLDDGVDTLELRGTTRLPSPLVAAMFVLDGGLGGDYYGQDATVIPPFLPFASFEIFLP